jgi:hypothetical protein
MYKDLGQWLDEHPGYTLDRSALEEVQSELEQALVQRRGRKKKESSSSSGTSSGDYNVAVVNRESGKRISGPKAPLLRHLKEWLQQNPAYDVDPKWAHVVQAKVRVMFVCIHSCISITFALCRVTFPATCSRPECQESAPRMVAAAAAVGGVATVTAQAAAPAPSHPLHPCRLLPLPPSWPANTTRPAHWHHCQLWPTTRRCSA